jgi:hypothetical protein|tara:strand:+ start:428 stop:697 length:270 start_codon:yes stop_codon:yes gene_type:complete
MNVLVGSVVLLTAFIVFKILKPESRRISPKKEPPTKKINPYFAFCKEKRSEIVTANPELKSREIVKKLGEEWRKLSDEEKDRYRITSSS